MKSTPLRPFVEITTPKWLHSAPSTPTTHAKPSSVGSHIDTPAAILHRNPYRVESTLECVQIEKPRKRKRPSSTQPSSSSSPRKRRKPPEGIEQRILHSDTRSNSPTVSELYRPRLSQSPTVSDIANYAKPTTTSDPPVNAPAPPMPEDSLFGDDDFEFEDENLFVPGEDVPERGFEDEESDEDVPVRLLNDFSVYDDSAGLPVEFATLDDSDLKGCNFYASGIVSPWLEPDEDDAVDVEPDFDYPRVKLSRLLELDIHHYNDGVGSFDGKIYLRTKHAWYILDTPAQSYQQLFKSFFIHHRLSHILLCRLLQDEELSMDEFKRQLKTTQKEIRGPKLIPDIHAILGHSLKEKDLDRHTVEYLSLRIPQILSDNGLLYLQKSPIVTELTGTRPRTMTKAKPSKKQVQRLQNPVVTPTVKNIVQDLFEMTMDVAGTSTFEEEDEAVQQELRKCKEHHEDPKLVKWGRRLAPGLNFYESVSLDGEIYKVISSAEFEVWRSLMVKKIGDDVMVSVEEGEDDEWAAPGIGDESSVPADGKSSSILDPAALITEKGNYYANHVWFCKISYFFDDPKDIDTQTGKPVKKFHGQWYQHGSRTILQETAHSRSLYLLASCDDNPIATIFRKCSVKFLEPGQNEENDDKAHLGAEFHCSLMWDEDQLSFIDIPTLVGDDLEALCRSQPEHKKCMGCALQECGEADLAISKVKNGFSRNNIVYHLNDFVYLKRWGTNLLDIAQILGMKATNTSVDVRVKLLARRRSLVKAQDNDRRPSEEKQLVDANKEQRVDFNDIDGKCFVRLMPENNPSAIEEWIQDTDHWFLNEEQDDDGRINPITTSKVCEACLSVRERELRDFGSKLRRRKLRGLELFAGAGGLGTGMDRSGIVETRWAVDNWGPAAKSYEANHPTVKVYCQDVNSLLQHAIDTREGKRPKQLKSHFTSSSLCPPMPARGEVDFIFGGPPCQPYSGANHHKKADDVRSTLPCTMLSFVEEYEPDYFLLENVIGFLRHPLKSTQDGRRLKGGIRMGMTKMIVRVLIGLGYQVHFKVLQAGDYGSPQSRERIIFWGAKRGLKLPDFPPPTHIFESKVYKIPCNQSRTLPPPTRSKDPEVIRGGEHRYAPLKTVTVRDAIDDLPPFDWVNPHIRIPETQKDKRQAQARQRAGIEQCVVKRSSAWSDLPGFPNGGEYSPPQTLYQKWMREKMGDGELVYQHVTSACGPHIVEATVNVPLEGNACHKDLPSRLVHPCARPGGRHANQVFYGRVDYDQYFRTALTSAAPNTKGIRSLHPKQKRMFSGRETARSQGFPDHYVFLSEKPGANAEVVSMYKQIGNAVPVPLALALGKELGNALKVNWEREARESSPEI